VKINVQPVDPSKLRSISNPVSSEDVSTHVKSIDDVVKDGAASVFGAVGAEPVPGE